MRQLQCVSRLGLRPTRRTNLKVLKTNLEVRYPRVPAASVCTARINIVTGDRRHLSSVSVSNALALKQTHHLFKLNESLLF